MSTLKKQIQKIFKRKQYSRKTFISLLVVSCILFALLISLFILFCNQKKVILILENEITRLESPRSFDDLLAKIRMQMTLPNEIPTIATVTDPLKLQNQPFFEHARKGDKVLIFMNAKKAVLYRPETDTIIEVGPLWER